MTEGVFMDTTDKTYVVEVAFTVHEHSDPYLQSTQAIQEEFEHWLEGLKATVHFVNVQPADEKKKKKGDGS
jgi:hypothetical protein